MKLFYVARTRSTRPRWVLEELGLPYELVRLDPSRGEHRTPEHLARHPLGHVPALEDGDVRIFESVAICLYLAERYGGGRLLPPPATAARAAVYQWICFALTELEAPLGALAAARRAPEAERSAAEIARLTERIGGALAVLDAALAGRAFLVGDDLGVADVLVTALSSYALLLRIDLPTASLAPYLARLKQRPAYRRAMAD